MVIINVLSNTQATLEAQFMPKLSNTKADLKKKKLVVIWWQLSRLVIYLTTLISTS